MIVNTGAIELLNSQNSFLAGLLWGLFTNNFTIALGTVRADLTIASWTGYASVSSLTWSVPTIVASRAVNYGTPNPSFGNSSGSSQNFYGWFCYTSGGILVAAVNLGLTVLANGGTYTLTPTLSDRDG